jgi:AraC-like DNA-binding protein
MHPEIFSTQGLHPQDQMEGWREWYSPVFELVPKNPMVDGFSAEIQLWKLGGLAMSRTTSPPAHVFRTGRHLRLDPTDHWVISYCVRGAHSATTAGTTIEVPAKIPYLWSLAQDFAHERTGVDRIQFFLSRDAFRDLVPLLDAALGSTLHTPLGLLLGDYMTALERRLVDVEDSDFSGIRSAVGAMIAAAVAPSARRVAVARGQIDLGRKERVRQAVRRHLRTPTLEPKSLARLVGVSRSNLYRLFEDVGGVARYIQDERLLEARTVLCNPATTQSISAIAEDLCFPDASSFARAFKRKFGCSPSDVRYAGIQELPPGLTQRAREPSAGPTFSDLLRGF